MPASINPDRNISPLGSCPIGHTTRQVRQELGLKPDVVYDVWRLLESEGIVVREGERRWTRFRLATE